MSQSNRCFTGEKLKELINYNKYLRYLISLITETLNLKGQIIKPI